MSLADNLPDVKSKTMSDIQLYGWNEKLFQQKQESTYKDFMHGRDVTEYPCTGDWILFQPTDADKRIFFDRLPRSKTLYRLKAVLCRSNCVKLFRREKRLSLQGSPV